MIPRSLVSVLDDDVSVRESLPDLVWPETQMAIEITLPNDSSSSTCHPALAVVNGSCACRSKL